MKQKNKWRFLVIFLALAIPLLFIGDADAWQGDTFCLTVCHETGGAAEIVNPDYNKDSYLLTGHKNMLRAVCPGGGCAPLTGPDGTPYATDSSGHAIDWALGLIDLNDDTVFDPVSEILYYVFDGWYRYPTTVRSVAVGGTYACARCHTTGHNDVVPGPEPAAHVATRGGLGFNAIGSTWYFEGIQCERCHDDFDASLDWAAYHDEVTAHPGLLKTYQDGTALCMECHRQEHGGVPVNEPGLELDVGGHGGYAPAFYGHSLGSQFLNSPHARFEGTFAEINDKTKYDSAFRNFATGDNRGCGGCHDVHQSTVDVVGDDPLSAKCGIDCHDHIKVANIRHPAGPETPIQDPLLQSVDPCIVCHLPKINGQTGQKAHLFRMNLDPDYRTFPTRYEFCDGTCDLNSDLDCEDVVAGPIDENTLDPNGCDANSDGDCDDTGLTDVSETESGLCSTNGQKTAFSEADHHDFPAVWLDLDLACGQCHGGGENDVDNPPLPGVPYMNKAYLAAWAHNIHQLASARFNWFHGSACYEVCFDASMNHGDDWGWDFGGTGAVTSGADDQPVVCYQYDAAGSYAVTLEIDHSQERTMIVTAKGDNAVPDSFFDVYTNYTDPCAAGDPCTDDETGMTARVIDGSSANSCGATTDGTAYVMWGDGTTSVEAMTLGNATWDHQYNHPGTYHISYCVKDSNGNKSCADKVTVKLPDVATAVFDVSGTICIDGEPDGDCDDIGGNDTAVANVTLYLKHGSTIVKMGKTDANGDYLIKNVPELAGSATYTVEVKKNGYSFAAVTDDQVNLADPTADFIATLVW